MNHVNKPPTIEVGVALLDFGHLDDDVDIETHKDCRKKLIIRIGRCLPPLSAASCKFDY